MGWTSSGSDSSSVRREIVVVVGFLTIEEWTSGGPHVFIARDATSIPEAFLVGIGAGFLLEDIARVLVDNDVLTAECFGERNEALSGRVEEASEPFIVLSLRRKEADEAVLRSPLTDCKPVALGIARGFDVLAVIRATAPATLPVVSAGLASLVELDPSRLGTGTFERADVILFCLVGNVDLVIVSTLRTAGEDIEFMRVGVEISESVTSKVPRPLAFL